MARPRKHKRICKIPESKTFNSGAKRRDKLLMSVDEYETIRLIDYEKLTQQECAKQMQVARTTVTSVYESARYKFSDSIINNKQIIVEGGDFTVCSNSMHCCGQCGKSKCRKCRHGSCENCIGIYHEPGRECYVLQS